MNPVPPNIDDQLWRLAESGNEAQRAEFVTNYPHYCDEMERRISLLTRFKDSKLTHAPKGKFVPSAVVKPIAPPVPTWLFATMCLVVVSSLSFAGYATVQYLSHKQAQEALNKQPEAVIPASYPITTNRAPQGVKYANPQSPTIPQPDGQNQVAQTTPQQITPDNTATQPIVPVVLPRWDSPVTLVSKHTDLTSAVLSIASQVHVAIELAPGVGNPDIEIDYRNQGAQAVLEDLGNKLGFTVEIETDTKALILPAIDPHAPVPRQVGTVVKADPNMPKQVEKSGKMPPPVTHQLPVLPSGASGDATIKK